MWFLVSRVYKINVRKLGAILKVASGEKLGFTQRVFLLELYFHK